MRPPRLAAWLLRTFTPREERAFLVGDLDEEYRERLERGLPSELWYWRQTLGTLWYRIGRASGARSVRVARPDRSRRGDGPTLRILSDLRLAFRCLRREPMFTTTAVGTLALGIGGTVAVFSTVQGVVLTPLPYEDPDRVVRLWETRPDGPAANMSYPDVEDVRVRTRTLSDVVARTSWPVTLQQDDGPRRLLGASVSGTYFEMLGVLPAAGRFFTPAEDELGHEPVVVISHTLWTSAFGGDPDLVGRPLQLSDGSYTIVGVAPADFEDVEGQIDVWRSRPAAFDVTRSSRTGHGHRPLARIAAGFTLADVNADLARISAELVAEYPAEKTGDGFLAQPVKDVILGDTDRMLSILFGAVGLVLLIACANVANLTVSRALTRERAMAVRAALGARRADLLRQAFAESALLALLGGALGVVAGDIARRVIVELGGSGIPRLEHVDLDAQVLVFAMGATLATTLLFGFAPALRTARPAAMRGLRSGAQADPRSGRRRLKAGLVVSEVALATALLTGAGLLMTSFARLNGVERGVSGDDVLTMRVGLSGASPSDHDEVTRYWARLLEEVRALPGVEAAAATSFIPLSGGYDGEGVRRADRPEPGPGEGFGAEARAVTPGYFSSVGMTLLRGRDLLPTDEAASPPVLVVNEAFARSLYPGEDPIGARVVTGGQEREIVGVVSDVRQFGVLEDVRPEMYAPHAQTFFSYIRVDMDLAVRTASAPQALAEPIRRTIHRLSPTVPVTDVRTLEQLIRDDVASPRFQTLLLGAFAALALTMAAVGIGGVMAFTVAQRNREIGVRMALGAEASTVARMVLVDGLRLTAAGLVIGLASAVAGSRLLERLLYDTAALDPIAFTAAPVTLILAALLAALAPAVRAARTDPVSSMRS